MKKLAVPFLVLSLAAFGCSSSSSNKDAGGGSGGSTGGSGGSTGGSGGSTGGSGGSTGGRGGTTTTDAGGHPDGLMASCTVVTDTTAAQSMVLSAADFCTNLQANCAGMLTTAYTGTTACEAAYNASTRQHCQSYHLCWGVEGGGADGPGLPNPHCSHAQGAGPCAPLDAAAGN